jgi:general secretion pathway protein A
MYKAFFGLRQSPFDLTPDPNFLYLTAPHREVLAGLSYAILAHKGVFVLTGDAGTGKTTMLRNTMQHLPESQVLCSVILNPTLSPAEFMEATLIDFGFRDIPASKARRVWTLQDFLWKAHLEKRTAVLVVDEAHKLSLEVLEEIRLLGNFESTDEKLLQIVLLGQNELDELLNCEHLRQFRQRIALRMQIGALQPGEVGPYIQHRWTTAGGAGFPFSTKALAGIAQSTQGIPRLINSVCDNALLDAYADESRTIEARHVATACRDLHLSAPVLDSTPAPPAPVPESVGAEPTPAVVPVGEPFPVVALGLKTLQGYSKASRPSLLGRMGRKLGLVPRSKTA